ncbi:MAG: SPASM domain-containing protein [Candidatus Gastranaerophilales bacterium]|nr:SPASM domain-containing protein [Candidatus Gastranaerophilales bacterium]
MKKHRICMAPFTEVEISEEGNVNCCCSSYTNEYFFGNIYEDSFDEIWNGEKAKAFRQDIIDGKYTYCNRDICNFGRLRPVKYPPSIEAPYPRFVTIAYDRTCNLMCTTCRDHLIRQSKFSEEELNENVDKFYLPICQNAREVILNSIGECLISKHSRRLIKKAAEKYPNLKFNIMTNGVACNRIVMEQLGLMDKISTLQVSIHAATEETYNKITRTGNFKYVMKNLKWISEQHKKRIFPIVLINFVVHSLNYKEMIAFVQLAQELDVLASFWELQKWSGETEMLHDYEKYTVFDKNHPEYNDFLEILKDPIFRDSDHCVLNSLFKTLRKEAISQ